MTKQTSTVWISRIFEEVIPFIPYLVRSRRKRRQAECKNILNKKNFAEYRELSEQQILCRLTEERLRASAMDEKTFKLSLSLSVGLTFLGLAATLLIKAIGYVTVQIILTSFIGLGVLYVLIAGSVAVGALRTLPSYGYGTGFLLQHQRQPQECLLAEALARQETMNIIRHLRNETAYQALRNGLLLLVVGILVFLISFAYQLFYPVQGFTL